MCEREKYDSNYYSIKLVGQCDVEIFLTTYALLQILATLLISAASAKATFSAL